MDVSVDALQKKIRKTKNPAILCLDLAAERLPEQLAPPEEGPAGRVCAAGSLLLGALAGVMPAVKLNTAYFEALGPAGAEALARLCRRARALDYYVILELNRCDPEPAAELLAQAYFGSADPAGPPPTCEADAVVLSAFTGSDGVRPYLARCRTRGRSVFLLARTANKSARELQDLIAGDRVVHTVVADLAMRWSTDLFGPNGYSQVGLVAGPPYGDALQRLRRQYDRLFLIVPGCGGPGLPVRDARMAFDKFGRGAAVEAVSVTEAWQQAAAAGGDLAEAARAAAEKLRDQLAQWVQVM